LSKSWRRDDVGLTREVVLLGSGVLDRYVWTVLGDECMDDGSFDQDIAALDREGVSMAREPLTRVRAAG
jgi:hypothetical protein